MKKLVLVLVAMFPLFCFSQNITVTTDSNILSPQNECPYRIAGICATEDIGGVEIRFEYVKDGVITTSSMGEVWLVLENYNNFTVSVLVEYECNNAHYNDTYIENYVLKAEESKMRRTQLGGLVSKRCHYLNGSIVRKLSGASTN